MRTRAVLGGLVIAAACAGVAAVFARKVLTPAPLPDRGVRVVDLDTAGSAGVQRVWLSGPDTDLDGSYSFIFDVTSRLTQEHAGHARLGPVVARRRVGSQSHVAREVISVDRGSLVPGVRGRITGWWYTDPAELGYPFRKVALPLPDGVGWAWRIEPATDSVQTDASDSRPWAIHVHGRGALPEETLRGVPPFAEAGYTNLVMSYRNDPGVPSGRNGRYGLGLAEWQDVDAAIGWARAQGATSVVLVGWSMGGTIAVLAASRGTHAELVSGLVLDSPALDWPGLLRAQAKLAHLPPVIGDLGRLILSAGLVRGAIPGERATPISHLTPRVLAHATQVPTLIHASAGDTFVPWQGALDFAKARPRTVRLHPSRGEHVKLWNVDPAGWRDETAHFLEEIERTRSV
ncbi:MAG: alpha/beta hydrolase [Microbacteriaceae bacterium]|nr:alpha/beta hydrolase [Microbacteriaceae bacterium]